MESNKHKAEEELEREAKRVKTIEQYQEVEGVSEDDVGIKLFLTTSKGFNGVLKQRYYKAYINFVDIAIF